MLNILNDSIVDQIARLCFYSQLVVLFNPQRTRLSVDPRGIIDNGHVPWSGNNTSPTIN